MTEWRDIWARSGKQLRRLAGFLAAALVIGFGIEWIATSNARMIAPQSSAVNDIALSPDGEVLAIAYANGTVELREAGHSRKLIRRFGTASAPVMDLHLDDATEAGLRLTMARADGRLVIETALEGQPLSDDITVQRSLLTPQFKVADDGAIWVYGVYERGPWIGRLEPGGNYAQPSHLSSWGSADMKLLSATSERAHLLSDDTHVIWGLYDPELDSAIETQITIRERVPLGEGYVTLQDGRVLTAMNGAWRSATETFIEEERGIAEMYGGGMQGEETASGEPFNPNAMTAAHPTLPFGSRILVINEDMNLDISFQLRVNDRGPFTEGHILGLTSQAANMIGVDDQGLANVRIKYLGRTVSAIGGATLETEQLETRTRPASLRAAEDILTMAYAPDGSVIATGTASGELEIWSAETRTKVAEISDDLGSVLRLKFSPDGRRLFVADGGDRLQIFDTSTWDPVASTVIQDAFIHDLAYMARGNFVAAATTSPTLRIRSAETLAVTRSLEGHSSTIRAVDFSNDSRLVLAGGEDGTIRVWNLVSREEALVIEGDGSAIKTAVFSPDDRYILGATANESTIFWDAQSGDVAFIIYGASNPDEANDRATDFSPDRRRMLTYESDDQLVRVWDVQLGDEPNLAFQGEIPGWMAALSPIDGNVLVSDGGNVATVWTELRPDEWSPKRNELPCQSEDGQAILERFLGTNTLWMWSKQDGICGLPLSVDRFVEVYPLPQDANVVKMLRRRDEDWFDAALIGRENGTVEFRRRGRSPAIAVYRGHNGPITHIEVSEIGFVMRIAIAAADGSIQIVDLPARSASIFHRWNTSMGRAFANADTIRAGLVNAIIPETRPPTFRRGYALPDPLAGLQWQLRSPSDTRGGAGFVDYWAETANFGSPDVVVAVIDTGVDFTHPSLQGANILPGWDMVADADIGGDGDARDSDPSDPGDACPGSGVSTNTYHGTFTIGALASQHDDIGIAGYAPGASYVPMRATGRCGGRLSDLNDAIRWAAGTIPEFDEFDFETWNENPADIIMLAPGLARTCVPSMQDAIDSVTEQGAIVIAPAGNRSSPTEFYMPGGCANVITVAASDARGLIAPYSNFGDQVDLLAPGGDLTRDDNADGQPDGILSSKRAQECIDPASGDAVATCDYAYEQGTAIALSSVAGALALLKSQQPDLSREDLINKLLNEATRAVPETDVLGPCVLYPGATPLPEDPETCVRPVGGRILDLSRLHGGVSLAPLIDPNPMHTKDMPEQTPEADTTANEEPTNIVPSTRALETPLPSTSVGNSSGLIAIPSNEFPVEIRKRTQAAAIAAEEASTEDAEDDLPQDESE